MIELGNRVDFHHTILRRDYSSMVYGGLHATRDGAEKAKAALVEEAYEIEKETKAKGWEENAEIIELEVGQEYDPWGDIGSRRLHGQNDGTHGSVDLIESCKRTF